MIDQIFFWLQIALEGPDNTPNNLYPTIKRRMN